jgi:hypothetical protein
MPTPPDVRANPRAGTGGAGGLQTPLDLRCVRTLATTGLRPPTSWNHKRTPPTPVELLVLEPACRYELEELTTGLTDPAPPRRLTSPPSRARRHPHPPPLTNPHG